MSKIGVYRKLKKRCCEISPATMLKIVQIMTQALTFVSVVAILYFIVIGWMAVMVGLHM